MKNALAPQTPVAVFLQSGDVFKVSDNLRTVTHDLLPGGVYLLEQNIFGFYLKLKGEQPNPSKIYGSVIGTSERIINSFNDRVGKTTGVLLTGEKGSGKTMLMNHLSSTLAKDGIPTIIINHAYKGDDFNTFISSIKQPAMLSFDEFEKVYDESDQEQILTLMSGLFETHKLVVLTVNNEAGVNKHMRNRPGRLFYRIRYNGVEEAAIRQYCEDRLTNKDHIDDVVALADSIMGFNFDMLVCLVEEMNRYNEPVGTAVKLMNIDFVAHHSNYEISLVLNDGTVLAGPQWSGAMSEERYRVVQFNVGAIKNTVERNRLAMVLEQHVHDTVNDQADRSESELSFVYKSAEVAVAAGNDEDDLSVDETAEAIANGHEFELSESKWQHANIHLRDSYLKENRGRVVRFKIPAGEVVMRRVDAKPNPFAYGSF